MKFEEIKPYIRYARYMTLNQSSFYNEVIPYDARLFFTESGEGVISAGGQDYRMPANSLLMLRAGVEYKIHTPKSDLCYLMLNFDLSEKFRHLKTPIPPEAKEFFNASLLMRCKDLPESELSDVVYIPDAFWLKSTLSDTVNEYNRRMLYFEEKLSVQLFSILTDVKRYALNTSNHGEALIDDIIRYVDTHYKEDLTNKKIAEEFSFHKNYIGTIVKRSTGLTLHQYLIKLRLNRAMDMMYSTGASVNEIAEECGFCDSAHFSKAFKAAYGVCPKKYISSIK